MNKAIIKFGLLAALLCANYLSVSAKDCVVDFYNKSDDVVKVSFTRIKPRGYMATRVVKSLESGSNHVQVSVTKKEPFELKVLRKEGKKWVTFTTFIVTPSEDVVKLELDKDGDLIGSADIKEKVARSSKGKN